MSTYGKKDVPGTMLTLLRNLANDDSFRARFESNPKKVLKELNIDVPENLIPTKINLPSKESLQNFVSDESLNAISIDGQNVKDQLAATTVTVTVTITVIAD